MGNNTDEKGKRNIGKGFEGGYAKG